MDNLLSEEFLSRGVDILVRLVESAGALVIFLGAMIGFVRFVVSAIRTRRAESFVPIRLDVGRYLALGLEFQLAGDILRTAIAPTFREIGELAAITTIRTALNYFLGREIKEERAEIARSGEAGAPEPRAGASALGDEGPSRPGGRLR